MTIQRIALGVSYDGFGFHGWQRQDNELRTVQDVLEKAVGQVADHSINATCAGRTDAGVHATAQVVHFDTEVERADYSWIFGVNRNLPQDVSIVWAQKVDHQFHARFSAVFRRYRYVIYNHPIRTSLSRHAVAWHHKPLDEERMHRAAQYLLGKHDFTAFRGVDCQAQTPIKTIEMIKVHRYHHLVVVEIKADAFLHHMVRNIVGVLLPIGEGRKESTWMLEVLLSRDRKQAGVTASPHGLYLVEVGYPDGYSFPRAPAGPLFIPEISE